jgi:glyoxylase-like metal-dependent hydrolase (beta-lactamase superfamily II)
MSAVSDDVPSERPWSEPGVELVAPGVHRVPLPLPLDGLRAVNVYVLETDDGLTCIDAGWAVDVSRELLETSLGSIGHRVSDIRRFLVTHVHRDHYTQAVTIRKEFGRATVELGIGEKPTLDLFHGGDLDEDPTVARLQSAGAVDIARSWQRMFEGREPDLGIWAYPDSWLAGDHTLEVGGRTLRVVPTPGHTAGHVVFADEQAGLLFAGDHVLPRITPSVGFELVYVRDPLGDFLGSLHTVRELPDLRLLPAHGPVTDSTHQRVDELLVHHDERLELCRRAVGGGAVSAYDVAKQLTWTRRERHLGELDLFNAALATMETLVHLDLLVFRGTLQRTQVDGTWCYSSADVTPRPRAVSGG